MWGISDELENLINILSTLIIIYSILQLDDLDE